MLVYNFFVSLFIGIRRELNVLVALLMREGLFIDVWSGVECEIFVVVVD